MIKEDVLQYLKDNLYIIQQGEGYIISNKFSRELGISSNRTIPLAPSTPTVTKTILKPANATKEIYKEFIQMANVPSKIDTANGSYWANRYSEPGFKSFAKVWNNPLVNRAVLLAATKWYYAQTRTARKMIGTYFSEGIWESCYDDFVRAKDARPNVTSNTGALLNKLYEPKDENASNMEAG